MQIRLIVLLIFTLFVAVFAVMNVQPVEINFIYYQAEVKLIFVIILSILIGTLFMFFISSMKQLQLTRKIRALVKENLKNKEEIDQLISAGLKENKKQDTVKETDKEKETNKEIDINPEEKEKSIEEEIENELEKKKM